MVKKILIGIGILTTLVIADTKVSDNNNIKKIEEFSKKSINDFADLAIKNIYQYDYNNKEKKYDLNIFHVKLRDNIQDMREKVISKTKQNKETYNITFINDKIDGKNFNTIENKNNSLVVHRSIKLSQLNKINEDKNLYEVKEEILIIGLIFETIEVTKEHPYGIIVTDLAITDSKAIGISTIHIPNK